MSAILNKQLLCGFALGIISTWPTISAAETSVDDFTAIVNTGSVNQDTQGANNQQNLNVGSATGTKANHFNAHVTTGTITQSSSGAGIVQSTNLGSATNSRVGSFNATVTTGNIEQISTRSGQKQEIDIGSVTNSTVNGSVNLNVTVKQGVTQTGSGEVVLGSVKNSNVQNYSTNLDVKGKVTGSNIKIGSIVGQGRYDDKGRYQGDEQDAGNNGLTLPAFTSIKNNGTGTTPIGPGTTYGGKEGNSSVEVKQITPSLNEKPASTGNRIKWYESLGHTATITGTGLDLLKKISDVKGLTSFVEKAVASRDAIKSFLKLSNNIRDGKVLDEFIKSFDLLKEIDPYIYDKMIDSIGNNDYSGLRSILEESPKWASKAQQILEGAENLGKFLSLLSVTLDASELAAKVTTGTASLDDWAKFVTNTTITTGGVALGMESIGGVAVGGTAAATVGTVFVAAYGSLQLGKALAELKDGITYSESQQTYVRNVESLSNGVADLEIGLTKKYSNGNPLDLKSDTELITKTMNDHIEVVNHMLTTINSTENLFTSAVAFESDERAKIRTALTTLLGELTNTQLQAENIVLSQYRLGHSVYETKLKEDIVNKLM